MIIKNTATLYRGRKKHELDVEFSINVLRGIMQIESIKLHGRHVEEKLQQHECNRIAEQIFPNS